MAKNATGEHVAVVLKALAEGFLVDIPALFDSNGVYYIEYTQLANALVNSPQSWFDKIAEHINATDED